jgi:hypothetical protein
VGRRRVLGPGLHHSVRPAEDVHDDGRRRHPDADAHPDADPDADAHPDPDAAAHRDADAQCRRVDPASVRGPVGRRAEPVSGRRDRVAVTRRVTGAGAGPSATPAGGGTAGGSTGLPEADPFSVPDRAAIAADSADVRLASELLAGLGLTVWFIPAMAFTVPGLLLVLAILAQAGGAAAWLPVVRRLIGSFGPARRWAPSPRS